MAEYLQELAWLVAVAGGVFAIWKALKELQAARENSERDLRWRKAQAASAMLDQFYHDDIFRDALTMLDWNGRPFMIDARQNAGADEPITHDDIFRSLEIASPSFDPKSLFIRTRIDRLFEGFDRIGHAIRIGVIEYADVQYALEFYITRRLVLRKDVVTRFMQTQGFDAALEFFNRCASWIAAGE